MLASISFNQSHKSSLSHNNREHTSGNKDIDPERLDSNIFFVKDDIRDVYKDLFQDAVDTYNGKQSRSDRKIENYYEKIHNDSKTHEQRELIVAIGEGKDSEEFRSGKTDALIKYAEEFQERNPNLRVFNMVLHNDEANPHLHINYVPHFESKRGLSRRVGMDKALGEQGIEGKGTELIGKWRILETSRIEELAKEHIPGFERDNVGSHKYMKVQEFKEYAETLNKVENEVENQKADLEAIGEFKEVEKAKVNELKQMKSDLVDEVKSKNFELKGLQRNLSHVQTKVQLNEQELQQSSEKLVELKKEVAKIEVPKVELESIKEKRFLNMVTIHKDDYEKVLNMAKNSLEESKFGLELENLKDQLAQYLKKLKDQERKIDVLEQQKEKYRGKSLGLERENKKLTLERNIFKNLYETVKGWVIAKGLTLEFMGKLEKEVEVKEKEKERTNELQK